MMTFHGKTHFSINIHYGVFVSMKVQVTIELGSLWDDYADVCDELLLEDMDLIRKEDMKVVKFRRMKE